MSKENIKLHIPRWKELPNVDLYLDQVVTLVNETLSSFLSYLLSYLIQVLKKIHLS